MVPLSFTGRPLRPGSLRRLTAFPLEAQAGTSSVLLNPRLTKKKKKRKEEHGVPHRDSPPKTRGRIVHVHGVNRRPQEFVMSMQCTRGRRRPRQLRYSAGLTSTLAACDDVVVRPTCPAMAP